MYDRIINSDQMKYSQNNLLKKNNSILLKTINAEQTSRIYNDHKAYVAAFPIIRFPYTTTCLFNEHNVSCVRTRVLCVSCNFSNLLKIQTCFSVPIINLQGD